MNPTKKLFADTLSTLADLRTANAAQAERLEAMEARLARLEGKVDATKAGVDSVKADTGRIPKDAKP